MFSLTLYSTSSCGLCDEAELLIKQILAEPTLSQLDIKVVKQDIRSDKYLISAYGQRIPVVALFENKNQLAEINWPFDRQQLVMWMVRSIKANMSA